MSSDCVSVMALEIIDHEVYFGSNIVFLLHLFLLPFDWHFAGWVWATYYMTVQSFSGLQAKPGVDSSILSGQLFLLLADLSSG